MNCLLDGEAYEITPEETFSQTEQDIKKEIMSLWHSLKSALAREDIETALGYIAIQRKEMYRYNFELFARKNLLKSISADMKEAVNCKGIEPNTRFVECEHISIKEGNTTAYPIQFVRDLDGMWKIYAF